MEDSVALMVLFGDSMAALLPWPSTAFKIIGFFMRVFCSRFDFALAYLWAYVTVLCQPSFFHYAFCPSHRSSGASQVSA
jgi:hypothetical protein